MRSHWHCPWCKAEGTLEHEATETVWNIARVILDTHRTLRPQCRASAQHIRARIEGKDPVRAEA